MERAVSFSQSQLSFQAERIKLEKLEPAVLQARQRAIKARAIGVLRSVQSSYNLGGWRSLFEEPVPSSSSSNAISHHLEISHNAIANPAPSVESSISADSYLSPSQSSNDSSSHETSSAPDLATMPLCPSGRPDAGEAIVFGVVGGTAAGPQVGYLTEAVPVNEDILALSGSVEPTEIFRMASTCAGHGCKHFDDSSCRLAMRIVEQLPAVVEALPACQIRPHCRWWQQEGKAACQRCPQVVTDNYYASGQLRQVEAPMESQ